MFFHRLFLFIWLVELIVFPIIALLDIGFSFEIKSNFYARFGYIAIFVVGLFYLFAVKRKIVFHPLILMFLGALAVGMLKGLLEGSLSNMGKSGSPVFLSHIFYVVMPIVMMSYGWFFFEDYKRSEVLQRLLLKVMYWAFFVGLGVVVLFEIAYQSGLASYNAIGLWNFVFSAPYLLYQPHGFGYFGAAILATAFAGKRGMLVVFVVFLALAFLLARNNRKFWAVVLVPLFLIAVGGYLFSDSPTLGLARVSQTMDALQEGKMDEASAGRWTEAISALSYLNSRADHMLVGAGFGAQFLPWPDRPDYSDYWSHYTHFGIVSYAWIGGLLLPLAVYVFLVSTGVSLVLKIKRGCIDRSFYHFVYWLWGIIAVSLFGAVLMNNAFLWFIIGCCFNLNRRPVRNCLKTRVAII